MSEKINWAISAQVLNGPRIMESKSLEIEAYDKIQVEIPNDTTDKQVDIQPGSAEQVHFIMIVSSQYNNQDDDTKNLSLKVNDTGNPTIGLDEPFFVIGKGAIAILDEGNVPTKLFFTNTLGDDTVARIQILVGRNATS